MAWAQPKHPAGQRLVASTAHVKIHPQFLHSKKTINLAIQYPEIALPARHSLNKGCPGWQVPQSQLIRKRPYTRAAMPAQHSLQQRLPGWQVRKSQLVSPHDSPR
jgi:hypothetical protein